MKRPKLFAQIIYYLFTFAIGIVFALLLPAYFVTYELPLTETERHLSAGEYSAAMDLVGGFFYKDPVFQRDFENHDGGIVLFSAVTSWSVKDESGKEIARKMRKSYAGYIYGVIESYDIYGGEDNKVKLEVINLGGKTVDFDLLSRTGTLASNGFAFIDIDQTTYESVKTLKFYDASGELFETVDCSDGDFDFSQQFFSDVEEFLKEYNRDDIATEEDRAKQTENLRSLGKEFQDKDENYLTSSESGRSELMKLANKKSIPIIIGYFVFIYILGDFLVGRHYIWRFFKWLHYKTPWGEEQALKRAKNRSNEAFGHDYYSQVTMSLNLSELPDFNESVQLRYSKDGEEITFMLMKENGYAVTERIKAGVYVNGWIDINRNYAPVDMPENLVVEGYKMDVKIKIIKRKEESV